MAAKAEKVVNIPVASQAGSATAGITLIKPPKMAFFTIDLVGTSPLVMAAFSDKARKKLMASHEAGSQSKSKKQREARNFSADMQDAIHYSEQGWIGFPASAFRAGMISACRLIGFKMTLAKLSVFIEADGLDKVSGQPLVKLDIGEPELHIAAVRNASGVLDLRARPMWRKWGLTLRVKYDADVFSAEDVANLLSRVGQQVGIGEGRADSRESSGMGWGSFSVTG
jgi:hypothetical protein